ncbi:DUF397 domain-containing protein [Streptomyces sp. HJ7]
MEVADGHPGFVSVRDSKDPERPALVIAAGAWDAFTGALEG